MPVVINEFELTPAGGQEEGGGPAAGAAGNAAAEAGQAAAPKPPKAPVQDMEHVLRRQHERMLRVRAY